MEDTDSEKNESSSMESQKPPVPIPTSSTSLYHSHSSIEVSTNPDFSSNIPSFITPSNHFPTSNSYLLPNSSTTGNLSTSFTNLNQQTFHAPTMVPVHNLNPNVPLPRFNSRRRLSYPLNAVLAPSFSNSSFPAPITPFNNSVAVSTTNLSPEKHIGKYLLKFL